MWVGGIVRCNMSCGKVMFGGGGGPCEVPT